MKKDWYSRPNGKPNGFKRRLLVIVSSEGCSKPVEFFFVIQYVWSDESKIAPFPPGKTYTNRAITSASKKLASPVARGKPMSPRDIVLEVASTIPEINREVNPYYRPKDMRQVMTIRNTVNKNTYGEDVESYLRRKEGVILRQYQNEDGSESENFVVVDPYHVELIATNGDQKLKCESIKVRAIAYSGNVDKVHASDIYAVNTGSLWAMTNLSTDLKNTIRRTLSRN
ncbi:hypothetical protein RvY_08892 [Ramazzottius varieornatus]|uniref:Uncharacterized protein n=1 Tax=Ramazzottius varieornatus TaxID=947166 RepID=A0A1D1V7H5_RAMVA|nr:hypothetical protein RvY_08892 [Ramazzottius varieornatus]